MKTIAGFVWLILAIIILVLYEKQPESTIMTWSCIIISNIYFNSIESRNK